MSAVREGAGSSRLSRLSAAREYDRPNGKLCAEDGAARLGRPSSLRSLSGAVCAAPCGGAARRVGRWPGPPLAEQLRDELLVLSAERDRGLRERQGEGEALSGKCH